MESLPLIIGALLLPVAIVAFVITLIKKINRHAFKALLETSGESVQMPSQTVRTTVLQYGFSSYRNAVSLGEQNGSLFIKIPLLPILQIPYKNLKEVKRSAHSLDLIVFTFHFRGENQKILAFTLREKELDLFPALQAVATAATQKSAAHSSKPSASEMVKSLKSAIDLQKGLGPTLPSNGNHIRNFFLVSGLIAGLVYLFSQIT